MSFTVNVKNEISKLPFNDTTNTTELSAIINNYLVDDIIKISTENSSFIRRIHSLMKDVLHLDDKTIMKKTLKNKTNYTIIIDNNVDEIKKILGINDGIPKEYVYDDEELKRAYIRGIFLSTGSVNDPKKSRYHLEILVDNMRYAEFIMELLNYFDLDAKYLKRDFKYMIYIKEAEKISDFLRVIEASNAVMYYEDIRIYRDHKNMTNRLNNCEQANMDKTIMSALNQINDINLIVKHFGMDSLDDKLKEVVEYRLKYPESSLQELSEIMSLETNKKITKSGLNHRLRKLKELKEKLK